MDYVIIHFLPFGTLQNFTDCALTLPFNFRHVTELHGLCNNGCQVPQSGQAKFACHQTMVPGQNKGMTVAPLYLSFIGDKREVKIRH